MIPDYITQGSKSYEGGFTKTATVAVTSIHPPAPRPGMAGAYARHAEAEGTSAGPFQGTAGRPEFAPAHPIPTTPSAGAVPFWNTPPAWQPPPWGTWGGTWGPPNPWVNPWNWPPPAANPWGQPGTCWTSPWESMRPPWAPGPCPPSPPFPGSGAPVYPGAPAGYPPGPQFP